MEMVALEKPHSSDDIVILSFKGTNGVALSEKEAKEKLRNDLRLQFALMSARRKAADFGNKLLDQKQQTTYLWKQRKQDEAKHGKVFRRRPKHAA